MIRLLAVFTVTALRLADAEPIRRFAVDQLVPPEREPDQKPVEAAVNQFHIVVATKRPDGPDVEIDLDIARRWWREIHDRSVCLPCVFDTRRGRRLEAHGGLAVHHLCLRSEPCPSRNSPPGTIHHSPATWIACARLPTQSGRGERTADRTRMALHESI